MPSSADAAELQALFEGVDHARKEAEATWGAERLPIIVDVLPNGEANPAAPEGGWRVRLRKQQAHLSTVLQAAWDADQVSGPQMQAVRDACAASKRAWQKLAEVASEAGHRPISGGVFGERLLPDGTVCAFVRDNDAARQVIAEGRCLVVYTLDELAYLIGSMVPESLQLAKVHFPGAVFQAADIGGGREWVRHGDEIPFGDSATEAA